MSVKRTAETLGIDYEEIRRNAEQVEEIAERKAIDLEEAVIVPNFDMNGPVVDKETVDYSVHDGVKKAMQLLDQKSDVNLSMLSGWDVNTLQFVAEDRLDLEMDHVGELGSRAVIDDKGFTTVDADYDQIVDFRRELLLSVAADGITINEQGNTSPVTGCAYGEGHRKDLFENHPIAQRSKENFSVEDLYNAILDSGVDEQAVAIGDEDVVTGLPERLGQNSGDYLAINLESDEAVEALTTELTNEYPLMGIKPEYVGGKEIRLTPNTEDNIGMSDDSFLSYFQRLMDGVASGTVFELEHNPDISTDYQRSDIEVSKEHGANYRAKEQLGIENFVLLNIGDKPGDILEGENTISFVQEDYPADTYAQEEGIPHVKAENAADYALTVADLIERN